jgi:N-acetylmuramoyl-L-alanine amidase
MKRKRTLENKSAIAAILIASAVLVCLAPAVRADKKTDAHEQFGRAVQMRTQLEGYLPKDRSLDDYKRTIEAYHKVYFIWTAAVEVTPSLMAQAELYEEMGKQFDAQYFQSSIDTYNFLIKQYPTSQYRGEAQLAVARIQGEDQHNSAAAVASYKDYLKQFPHSAHLNEVREAIRQLTAPPETVQKDSQPAGNAASATARAVSQPGTEMIGPVVDGRVSDGRVPFVKAIKTWNGENYTRIVVTLDGTIMYDVSHIKSPDRIYFDIYKARIETGLAHKTISVDDGLLKSVRVAQNKADVVRLVLDVNGAKDYSAYLVKNPYRLVIDVHTGSAPQVAKKDADSAPASTKAASGRPVAAASESVTVSANDPPPAETKSAEKVAERDPLPMSKKSTAAVAALPPTEPKPNRDGSHTLTRTLGLKINRIVIDAGHGGHDTGTIGPHGLLEKDLCLDVALRLGRMIEDKLPGAEVIYTRRDDTFIPLEERTAIANEAKADLFISIHANSSHDQAARGIETYYLNFATSAEAMDVATRENALSQESLHDLQDLIKKIARNDKIEESKEFADDVQTALTQKLQLVSHNEKNRGVKKAPFIVLIGANMPSVLSEISFVSNPSDEKLLRKPDQRQRIADGLYRGISAYLDSLNSLSYNKKPASDTRSDAPAAVADDGNHK